ncbi:MAG TPA: GIDE domain-containing protein [Candidatus Thermoplasmatota archaeon]|nr:GIDE domain-containing protein [Candidatus Thermoplasmatota archaeon]
MAFEDNPIPIVLLFLGGIVAFIFSWKRLQLAWLVRDTPTSKVASMAIGPVEVRGRIEPLTEKALAVGPLSQRPCVWYRYEIKELRQSGKNRSWVTVKEGKYMPDFLLRDETGAIVVRHGNRTLPHKETTELDSGTFDDPEPHVAAFLRSLDMDHETWLGFNKSMRFKEYFMPPGTEAYVLATAERDPKAPRTAEGNENLFLTPEGRIPFVVHFGQETDLIGKYRLQFALLLAGGIGALALAIALLTSP